MANVIYPMIIFIFCFGAALTYINDTGMYDIKMPESGVQSSLQQAEDTNAALLQTTDGSYDQGLWEQMKILGQSIFGGILAIFTLGPLLMSMGVPVGMAGMFISPLGFVAIAWLIEMWLGRPME
jgi:hypothetical protein